MGHTHNTLIMGNQASLTESRVTKVEETVTANLKDIEQITADIQQLKETIPNELLELRGKLQTLQDVHAEQKMHRLNINEQMNSLGLKVQNVAGTVDELHEHMENLSRDQEKSKEMTTGVIDDIVTNEKESWQFKVTYISKKYEEMRTFFHELTENCKNYGFDT